MADEKGNSAGAPLYGVSLAVMGTLITALGNHLIVKGHALAKKQENQRSTLFLIAGNVCVVLLGTVLGLSALAYAPQSVISPLGGLTVVWNLALATLPLFGAVKPKAEEFVYTLITLVGMAIVVAMGPQSHGRKASFYMLVRPTFVFVVLSYAAIIGWLHSAKSEDKSFRRIAAGAIGAMVGGLSNVFAKSAVEFYSGNQVKSESNDYITFYMIIVIALGLALSQLMLLNSALANFTAVQVIPIYQTTLCIAATVSGGIAFDEFRDMTLVQGICFVAGVMISALGVLLSALRGSTAQIHQDK